MSIGDHHNRIQRLRHAEFDNQALFDRDTVDAISIFNLMQAHIDDCGDKIIEIDAKLAIALQPCLNAVDLSIWIGFLVS